VREPSRGAADRMQLGFDAEDAGAEPQDHRLFAEGLRTFTRELIVGLRADARTILSIPTMRYALVGVSALLFTITAVGAALPQFYERNLGVGKGTAEAWTGVLVVVGGIPGVLLGGRFADRYMTRVRGARVAIPAACPPVFLGALVLLRARDHLDADAARILQAILTAMQEQEGQP